METKILSGEQGIKAGAEIVRAGGVVAFPTETVYGLAANAFDPQAVRAVFAAKGRPMDNPLIVHLPDKNQIGRVTRGYDKKYEVLVETFMPGPLTLVVPRGSDIPDEVTAGLDTVGVRVPSHPVCARFLAACGVPVAAPSANLSTRISPTSARHVFEDMNGRIPLIIDGGECEVGIESTVLDITGEAPVVLRPGAVTAEMIAHVLGEDVKSHSGKVLAAAPAPGMKYKHYAPACECVVAENISSALACYERQKNAGKNPVILCRGEHAAMLGGARFINLGGTDEEVCRNVYAALHKGEKTSDFIICEDLGDRGVAASVMNRVNKAAGGKRV